MAFNKTDSRQIKNVAALPMVGSAAADTLDTIFPKIDAEMAKLYEDRNIMLTDGGIVTYTGTQVQFTEALNIVLNQKISGAAPQIISLAATTRTISASGRMIYALINRTAGTATITDDAATLPAVTSANQEVFLIAKRVDATDGTQRLYFRNGAAFNAGQSARLGSAGSGSGGSGVGDDLNALTFKADVTDNFDDIPSSTNSAVDTTAGTTDATLYSAVSALFQLNYDAAKTVTTVGTTATLSGTPTFTVKQGDMLIVAGQVKRIVTVTTQTSYILDSALTANVTAVQATVSQAVYSKDLNNFAADGLPISTAFSTTINQIMAVYEDTSTPGDKIFDANTVPVIAYSASSDGTNYTTPQIRPTNLNDQITMVSLPTAGTNLYMRFFANKTSGSGTVNVLGYKVFFHREISSQDGTLLNQASALTNGTGTQVNVLQLAVLSAKTVLKLNWSFPVGVNVGSANGSLKVYLNGQKIPRFISATATPDASYTEIDQNTIQLDQDYSSLSLLLEVIQDVAVVDASDTNVTAISQIQESQTEGFQGFVKTSQLMNASSNPGTPAAGTFHSTVVNRAAMSDLTQDLRVRMGIERVMTQSIVQLQNEFGPNGEPVWATPNDQIGQIRFVGSWVINTNSQGPCVFPNLVTAGDFVEVTFYGTGLNMLTGFPGGAGGDLRVSVNGGSEGSNVFVVNSTLANGRGYTFNAVLPLVTGLSLGVHTVRIRNAVGTGNAPLFQGFEILSQSLTLLVNPGSSYLTGKKSTLVAQQTLAFNSGFESGVLGTRGGRVLVYQKADGSIAKAVQPVNAAQAVLAAADHTNEEVARTYYPREFGAGRADDFSRISATPIAAAFTLDDGTTTLASDLANVTTVGGIEASAAATNLGFQTLTFVGTGLDILRVDDNSGSQTNAVTVDGASIGNLASTAINATQRIEKVVSGLPYGTHTVKIIRPTGAAYTLAIAKFIVYQPKKPTLPSGAVELADYNVMADFVANTVGATDTISTGVLRKMNSREFVYVNGTGGTTDWTSPTSDVNSPSGFEIRTDRTNGYFEYTFFGTGFDFRFSSASNRSANITALLNGLALTSANFSGVTASTYGTGVTYGGSSGASFALPASNTLDMNDAASTNGAGFRISGLPLGRHTIRFNNNTASSNLIHSCFDIITPIHSPKSNLFTDLQNTLPVGSQGISDNRKTSPIKDGGLQPKSSARAIGVVVSPTTTSTSFIPCPDMSVTLRSALGGKLKINGYINWRNSGINGYGIFVVYINGIQIGVDCGAQTYAATVDILSYINETVIVGPGVHKVDVYWRTASGTLTAQAIGRNLTVEES